MDRPALRIDFLHAGTPAGERYQIAAWAASASADPHGRGQPDPRGGYRWTLFDERGVVLASRGYSTLLEEWQSTVLGQGEDTQRDFRESHCVPWFPGATLRLERRGAQDRYESVFETTLPAFDAVPPAPPPPPRTLRRLAGPAQARPVLFVAEGYAADEAEAFFAHAQRACEVLLGASPFAEQAQRLAVAALHLPSPASGIPAQPEAAGAGTGSGTNFGTSYGTFGMARYMVSTDLHALHRVIDGIPHTTLVLLCNATEYGGSGIFNSNATVAAGMDELDFGYVLLHELGHSLGGLGDEYFGKDITYQTDADEAWMPWEPNVSLLGADGRVKWAERVAAAMPLPSPWRHADFLALVRSGAPAAELRARTAELLESEPLRDRVGAFEGARYQAHGMYRPEVDCRMFSKSARRYCAVCQDTMVEVLAGIIP